MTIPVRKTICFMDTISNVIMYLSPNVQRLLNEEHVSNLITDQMWEYQRYKQFSMLQSITCADLDGKRYVLDGQHRLAAFKELFLKGYTMNVNIPVVCYNVATFDELKEYYIRINKHHPINPLEVSSEWFDNGKSFCTWFVSEYKPYIKYTENKCNCPHININEMMKYIKEYQVFERLRVGNDVSRLIEVVKGLNEYMIQQAKCIVNYQFQEDFSKRFTKCVQKNPTSPCIFGVWRRFEWIEIVLYVIRANVLFSDINLSQFNSKRTNIPVKKRIEVWRKRNGKLMDGSCFVCKSSLNYCDMECGHIVPFIYGGTCQVENLEPICKICNRDMGIVNLNEYIKLNNL